MTPGEPGQASDPYPLGIIELVEWICIPGDGLDLHGDALSVDASDDVELTVPDAMIAVLDHCTS